MFDVDLKLQTTIKTKFRDCKSNNTCSSKENELNIYDVNGS